MTSSTVSEGTTARPIAFPPSVKKADEQLTKSPRQLPVADHLLSEMWSMIEEIQPEDRDVFEPACGHAPFLTAAMRWLRDWGQGGQSATTHDYLRSHLHGLEF